MKPSGKFAAAIERLFLSRVKSSSLFAEYYNRTEKKAPYKRQAIDYNAKEINDWRMAVMAATDPDNPRRGELMRFYRSLMLDNHLSSVIDTRLLRVIRSSYKVVDANGNENEELKALLERPWFEELIRLVLSKLFQGTTLIELFDLDENGELVRVSEIPQSNYIAQKGLIIKEEWDNTGVSYTEGTYKDYYLQVGSDWDLGMLNQLAMIVLAKKLGLGSWMSFIDKFGVPPIFAVTERMDTARRDELFDMLTDFRMNHFAVLQGNEKVEIPNNYNTDAYNSFRALSELCNNEMSKRVLGGTALVDEKSFVGSSQVQERVAADRYESDKLFFKYVFNTFVRPRLVKISSVYSAFATHSLTWDNQETLDITGYIDGVQKLSQYYDFDVEEIKNRTGLPVIGIRQQGITASTEPEPGIPQKKKPNAKVTSTTFPLLYGFTEIPAITGATWDNAIERVAEQIYQGKLSPADLDNDLVLKNYSALSKASQTGWGKDYNYNDKARIMRNNLMKFSGAKAYNLMFQIKQLKNTSADKEEFIKSAKKIVNLHNETYLNVEKQFTSAKASAAKDWQQYQKDRDIYPNLKLRTMEDDHVREQHEALNGLVKAVNDWKEVPPFDPGCRCRLEQTTDPVSAFIPEFEFNNQYANNPGITGEVFTDHHNYYKNIAKNEWSIVKNNIEKLKLLTSFIQDPKYAKLKISEFAHIAEADENITAARIIIDNVDDVNEIKIRPHTEVNKVANPEYLINGNYADAKRIKSFKGIKYAISEANDQGCKYVVFDLNRHFDKAMPLDIDKAVTILSQKARMHEARKMLGYYFVYGKKAVYIDSKTAKKGGFANNLKTLKP